MNVEIACSGITWRKRGAGEGLADIAAAGYRGAPINGVEDHRVEQIRQEWASHGLTPAPGYLNGEFWDANQMQDHVDRARRYAAVSHELGLTEIFIAVGGFDTVTRAGRTRRQASAQVGPDDALTDEQFLQMANTITDVCEIFLDKGVRACFHSHVGTFVETEEEIESLLAAVHPEVLFVGPDTGHMAWAGIDVVDFFRRHADRIGSVHLKDVDLTVRDQGQAAQWSYADFERKAIWTELGHGDLDSPALFSTLREADYTGWLTVETDVTQQPTPFDSARISREYLRTLGI